MNFYKINHNGYKGSGKAKKIALLGMLFALTMLIQFLSRFFEWPFASFLTFDFSLLPIIIALFVYDFWTALGMLLLRLGFQMATSFDKLVFWYGPLIQLIVAFASLVVITMLYKPMNKLFKSNGGSLVATLAVSVLFEIIWASLMNWSWATPLFVNKLLSPSHTPVNPFEFNDYYKSNPFIKGFLGGWPSWHIAAWATFAPFNLVKFGLIAIISYPLISATSAYFSGERITFHTKNKI